MVVLQKSLVRSRGIADVSLFLYLETIHMSYRFHLMAAQVPLETMQEGLEEAVTSLGGTCGEGKGIRQRYSLSESKGWSVCFADDMGIIPALEVALSKQFDTDLVGVDIYEVPGYRHLSVLHRGEAKMLYTCMGDELDNQGIDWEKETDAVIKSGIMRIHKSMTREETIESVKYCAEVILHDHYQVGLEDLIENTESGEHISVFLPSKSCQPMGNYDISWREIASLQK